MKLMPGVGARSNYPKPVPVWRAAHTAGLEPVVDTWHYYHDALGDAFPHDIGLAEPDVLLGVGSASPRVPAGCNVERFEPVLAKRSPDWLVVYGDVNSTLGASVHAAGRVVSAFRDRPPSP
jgi:UDP-N-acetylglucosamine 2-epimerase (non-hydrolysing)